MRVVYTIRSSCNATPIALCSLFSPAEAESARASSSSVEEAGAQVKAWRRARARHAYSQRCAARSARDKNGKSARTLRYECSAASRYATKIRHV